MTKTVAKDKLDIESLTKQKTKIQKDLEEKKKTDEAKINEIVKQAKNNLENKITEGKVALEQIKKTD